MSDLNAFKRFLQVKYNVREKIQQIDLAQLTHEMITRTSILGGSWSIDTQGEKRDARGSRKNIGIYVHAGEKSKKRNLLTQPIRIIHSISSEHLKP